MYCCNCFAPHSSVNDAMHISVFLCIILSSSEVTSSLHRYWLFAVLKRVGMSLNILSPDIFYMSLNTNCHVYNKYIVKFLPYSYLNLNININTLFV